MWESMCFFRCVVIVTPLGKQLQWQQQQQQQHEQYKHEYKHIINQRQKQTINKDGELQPHP